MSFFVLVEDTIVVMKHHDQKQLQEERAYFTWTFITQSSIEGSRGRNSNRVENSNRG